MYWSVVCLQLEVPWLRHRPVHPFQNPHGNYRKPEHKHEVSGDQSGVSELAIELQFFLSTTEKCLKMSLFLTNLFPDWNHTFIHTHESFLLRKSSCAADLCWDKIQFNKNKIGFGKKKFNTQVWRWNNDSFSSGTKTHISLGIGNFEMIPSPSKKSIKPGSLSQKGYLFSMQLHSLPDVYWNFNTIVFPGQLVVN